MLTPQLNALKDQLESTPERNSGQNALLDELRFIYNDQIIAERFRTLAAHTAGGQVTPKNRCKCCQKPLP